MKIWAVNLFFVIMLTGCSVVPASNHGVDLEASSTAPSSSDTTLLLPSPTDTFEPTKEPYAIEMERFTNFPQSYDYLVSHLDEFVQSPDPINDRAAFDKWFADDLVPALGPWPERERNVNAYASSARYSLVFNNQNAGAEITGQLHSFYFVNNNVVYFTTCIHAAPDGQKPGDGVRTVCVALFDHPQLAKSNIGNKVIEEIAQGHIYQVVVYFDPKLDRPDLDYGDMEPIIKSVGEYADWENKVLFGFGFIWVYD